MLLFAMIMLAQGTQATTEVLTDDAVVHAVSASASFVARSRVFVYVMLLASIGAILCMMQPFAASMRLPPRYDPSDPSQTFRTWSQDLMLWSISSELQPHQQAAMIISQLSGPARELARSITPQEVFQGGVHNGNHLDPVSYLAQGLASRFAPLDDETRLRAAQDLLAFQRRQGETVDALITRFELTRSRARNDGGGAQVSVETGSLLLLRACGVTAEQFQALTQPFGFRLPSNDEQFNALCAHIRRLGHIIERQPLNIASTLRHNPMNQHGQQNPHFRRNAYFVGAQRHMYAEQLHFATYEVPPDAPTREDDDASWFRVSYGARSVEPSEQQTPSRAASRVADEAEVQDTPRHRGGEPEHVRLTPNFPSGEEEDPLWSSSPSFVPAWFMNSGTQSSAYASQISSVPNPAQQQSTTDTAVNQLTSVFSEIHAHSRSVSRGSRSAPSQQEEGRARVFSNTCTICLTAFEQGDDVLRASCDHVFHALCFSELMQHSAEDGVQCPNCRAPCTAVSTWLYMIPLASTANVGTATASAEDPEQANAVNTPVPTEDGWDSEEEPFHSPQPSPHEDEEEDDGRSRQSFAWWPVPRHRSGPHAGEPVAEATYHSQVRLRQGMGLLIDPGSYGNLVGSEKQITPPPVVEESSAPALLGLRSLKRHNAILDMSRNMLHLLPDDTQAELVLPTGAESFPLEQSESGHLLLPFTDFVGLRQSRFERPNPRLVHLFADDANAESMAAVQIETRSKAVAPSAKEGSSSPAKAKASEPNAPAAASAASSASTVPRVVIPQITPKGEPRPAKPAASAGPKATPRGSVGTAIAAGPKPPAHPRETGDQDEE
ncbi:unnamed protein product [Durusdinium trenchii]|uniref:RING-type domain-containing protein n=1 Tax=Durusdinium trenchii TaxID=1381693 RepID=A0ABP0RJF4_9DINO